MQSGSLDLDCDDKNHSSLTGSGNILASQTDSIHHRQQDARFA
jgi:hypothetical protein